MVIAIRREVMSNLTTHPGGSGSSPIRSFTALRNRCLHPRYRSVVCMETCPNKNWSCSCYHPPDDRDGRRSEAGHGAMGYRERCDDSFALLPSGRRTASGSSTGSSMTSAKSVASLLSSIGPAMQAPRQTWVEKELNSAPRFLPFSSL